MIPRRDREHITDRSARSESTAATLANDPTENADSAEPSEPIDKIEPIEPMDNTDPFEPMHRIESCDLIDHRDEPSAAIARSSRIRAATIYRSSSRSRARTSVATISSGSG